MMYMLVSGGWGLTIIFLLSILKTSCTMRVGEDWWARMACWGHGGLQAMSQNIAA